MITYCFPCHHFPRSVHYIFFIPPWYNERTHILLIIVRPLALFKTPPILQQLRLWFWTMYRFHSEVAFTPHNIVNFCLSGSLHTVYLAEQSEVPKIPHALIAFMGDCFRSLQPMEAPTDIWENLEPPCIQAAYLAFAEHIDTAVIYTGGLFSLFLRLFVPILQLTLTFYLKIT